MKAIIFCKQNKVLLTALIFCLAIILDFVPSFVSDFIVREYLLEIVFQIGTLALAVILCLRLETVQK